MLCQSLPRNPDFLSFAFSPALTAGVTTKGGSVGFSVLAGRTEGLSEEGTSVGISGDATALLITFVSGFADLRLKIENISFTLTVLGNDRCSNAQTQGDKRCY
jgi:hypothetical protein